jgi:3-hydroxyacyl-[acyl-carrier-protein] dehydratase
MLDIEQIRSILPHRYPFLLVDRMIEIVPNKSAKGYKNVSANEEFFNGHFPGNAIFPGVLICEALAQVGAVLLLSDENNKGKLALFAGIDKVRFRRKVVPGDRLDMEIEVMAVRGHIGKIKGIASVDGEIACEGEMMFALAAREPQAKAEKPTE